MAQTLARRTLQDLISLFKKIEHIIRKLNNGVTICTAGTSAWCSGHPAEALQWFQAAIQTGAMGEIHGKFVTSAIKRELGVVAD